MAVQDFTYTKISELTESLSIDNDTVFPITIGGVTKKIKYSTLLSAISTAIGTDISALAQRVTTLEGSVSSLGSTVSDQTGTINNIITAGFNVIGMDLPVQNNSSEGE